MGNPRFLVAFTSALAVAVIAFVVAIAVGEWWVLPIALVAHGIGFAAVMLFLVPQVSGDKGKPDPVTEARLEDEADADKSDGSHSRQDEPPVLGR